jgi:hypothetical protein
MRKLDLDDLLDNKKPVFVRNNALKTQLLLVIALKDKNGRNQTLKIPPTDIPINVSAQFSSDSIRESTDIRRLLFNQTLLLVDPEAAMKQLNTKEAKEQMKALSMSVYSDSAPSNAVRDTMERLNKKSQGPVLSAADVLNQSDDSDEVSLKVKGLIVSFQSKEKSSKDTLLQLKRMKPALNEADFAFIISQCKNETTIRSFAESALAELHAQPEQPFEEA